MGWNAGKAAVKASMIFAIACSTPKPAAREPTTLVRPANHCAEVAERLLAAFAQLEHKPPEPKMAAAYREVVVERCTQDVWSDAAQRCILKPGTDLDACTDRHLTPEQRASFAEAAQKKLNDVGTQATTK